MKTNKGIAHLFLLVVVIIVAIGAVGYLAYQNAQLKKQAGETTPTPSPTISKPPPATPNPTIQPTIEQDSESKIIKYKKAEGWPEYSSPLGFSFQYPPDFSTPHQNPVDPMGGKEKYCEFLTTKAVEEIKNNEMIHVFVRQYSGGSRRQLLLDTVSPGDKILSVTEIEHLGLKGLEVVTEPNYPNWEKHFSAIFIQGSTALMISDYQAYADENRWNTLLQSLSVNDSLYIDISECPNDW